MTKEEIREAVRILKKNSADYYDINGNRVVLISSEPIDLVRVTEIEDQV